MIAAFGSGAWIIAAVPPQRALPRGFRVAVRRKADSLCSI